MQERRSPMKHQWNRGELLSTSSAYWRGCALQAAVRLRIFTVLAANSLTAGEVAGAISADQIACGLLLDALTAMGLLDKSEERYANTPEARELLVADQPGYLGHIILHHHHILDGWAQLDAAVMTGKKVSRRSYGVEIERESFLMGMFNLAMGLAPIWANEIALSGYHRFLDLGGGPGTYAIHFCAKNPQLSAVIFDRPTTEPFARSTVAQFGLSERIAFAGGDFVHDAIPHGPYDVAWLSHILHSNTHEDCFDIIAKTAAVLEPGGLLCVHEFILDNDKSGPEFPALFSLNMLLSGNGGRSYSEGEIAKMLESAGLSGITRHPYRAVNHSSVIMGRKA